MQVFLIRHPHPRIGAGICYGQLDVECEDPQPIAASLRSLIPANTPVISSPLLRARTLAEALDPGTRLDPRLSEINFGNWEGRAWDEIERAALDAWAADVLHFTPPGGESVADLQSRAVSFAQSIDLPSVALVTHAGVMRALIGHWQQLPVEQWSRLQFDFGSLTEVNV
jgi:alpha-ribazole phosphatase